MDDQASRRDFLKASATLAATGAFALNSSVLARTRVPAASGGTLRQKIDAGLRAGVRTGDVAGVVAMAATEAGVVYDGAFGRRRLHDRPAMARDTIFGIASMVKLITTVAALRLVEQGKLSLEGPLPDIDPALSAPQVFDGFDESGRPRFRPARRPLTLHHLLTHTSGFVYRLWDREALDYAKAVGRLPAAERRELPRAPLMFDPGERWQYGGSIDWVGRLVKAVSGETLDVHFRRNILDPLGMKDTTFVLSSAQWARKAGAHRRLRNGSLKAYPVGRRPRRPPPAEAFTGGGGIYSTAPDYLTLPRMLLHGGTFNGARILRPETVALMGQNQIGGVNVGVLHTTKPSFSNDVDFFPGMKLKWGFGHMITTQPVSGGRSAGSLTWAGIANTYYWLDPKAGIAAVFMTQVRPFADPRVLGVYRRFEHGIYAAAKAGQLKAG